MPVLRQEFDTDSPSRAVFKKPRPGEMPRYELPDNQLSHGASLANARIWVNPKPPERSIQVFFRTQARVSFLVSI